MSSCDSFRKSLNEKKSFLYIGCDYENFLSDIK